MNSKQTKKNFENALFQALRSHGVVRPEKSEQEEGATENLLPAELQDGDVFVRKEAKVISLKSNRNKANKRSQYAKVAMKKNVKGKSKKKK
jgi:hypothetical protein